MESDDCAAVNEWEQETAFAKKVIDDVISRMPENLRAEALRIGYEFLKISEDLNAPNSMGEYCRSAERIRLYLPVIKQQIIEDRDEMFSKLTTMPDVLNVLRSTEFPDLPADARILRVGAGSQRSPWSGVRTDLATLPRAAREIGAVGSLWA